MVYPIVLACLACAVLIFLLTFFIPRFKGIFSELGGNLPALTQVIVAASQAVSSRYSLFLVGAIVAIVIGVRRAMLTGCGKRIFERAMLAVALLGGFIALFDFDRFSRML